jgi:hypothetical protein
MRLVSKDDNLNKLVKTGFECIAGRMTYCTLARVARAKGWEGVNELIDMRLVRAQRLYYLEA